MTGYCDRDECADEYEALLTENTQLREMLALFLPLAHEQCDSDELLAMLERAKDLIRSVNPSAHPLPSHPGAPPQ